MSPWSTGPCTALSCFLVTLVDSLVFFTPLAHRSFPCSLSTTRKTGLLKSCLLLVHRSKIKSLNSIQANNSPWKSTCKTFFQSVVSASVACVDVVVISNSKKQESVSRTKWTSSSTCRKCATSAQPSQFCYLPSRLLLSGKKYTSCPLKIQSKSSKEDNNQRLTILIWQRTVSLC